MPLVLIESPFHHPHHAGRQMHRGYLELALLDAINRNETPIATHKLYVDCLDDTEVEQRKRGMEMLLNLAEVTDYHVVYYDLGISSGMKWGIEHAKTLRKDVKYRSLFVHPLPLILEPAP